MPVEKRFHYGIGNTGAAVAYNCDEKVSEHLFAAQKYVRLPTNQNTEVPEELKHNRLAKGARKSIGKVARYPKECRVFQVVRDRVSIGM
jgi:hypothetical protein